MFVVNQAISARQVAPGVWRKVLAYSDDLMVCEFTLEQDAVVVAHRHPQVQSSYLVSGRLSFTLEGETRIIEPGDNALMLSQQEHEVTALEPSKVVDVFTPMRKDFLEN